jgi:hypothetical protein
VKYVRIIALSVSVFVIILHSLIPHQHHCELDHVEHLEQHQKADDLFDLLQLFFHIDLGGDHLNNYETAGSLYILPPYGDCTRLTKADLYLIHQISIFDGYVFTSSTEILQSIRFRGPPARS